MFCLFSNFYSSLCSIYCDLVSIYVLFIILAYVLFIVTFVLFILAYVLRMFYLVFEACYTGMDVAVWRHEIPLTGGLQYRVIAGGIIASTARAIIETPLEYAKVCAVLEE